MRGAWIVRLPEAMPAFAAGPDYAGTGQPGSTELGDAGIRRRLRLRGHRLATPQNRPDQTWSVIAWYCDSP